MFYKRFIMKQKIDMMVTIHGDQDRTKALTVAAKFTGVISVTIGGQDKNILTVIGDGVDIVGLTRSLKKKLGSANMVSVMPLTDYRFHQQQDAASMRYQGQPNYYSHPDYYDDNYNYKYTSTQPEYNGYYNRPVLPQYHYPPPRPPPDQYYYLCEEPAGDSSCSIM